MVDLALLRGVISESGMTMVAVAKKSNILRETLYNRLNGVGEFTATEIVSLAHTLHLNREERDKIFLAGDSELKSSE